MKLKPDDFPVVMNGELRELWKRYRDPDVRRLILEVHRAREVMNAAHADALRAQYALWQKQEGNVREALQTVTDRMLAEKVRLGAMGGIPPKR
jgi:glutamyl-tRNA reductase